VNVLRAKGCKCGSVTYPPAPPLTWNNRLELAANHHAADMFKNKYFNHVGLDGRQGAERIDAVGYNWMVYGENIAQGQTSGREAFIAWRKSPTHCENLMKKEFREMGVSVVGDYWVQEFGTLMKKKAGK
jgi:uncharacterized protein YkwD